MDNYFKNKVILITWWTWFLWRALTRKLLTLAPHSIRIYSRDEVKHFHMAQEFHNDERLRFLIWDIRDSERLEKATKGVDYVIHAAALKRLDLIEYNTEESVKTNIMWTLNLVRACEKNNVKKVVFVSSDKACSPINTYGASKFVSERIITESNYSNWEDWVIYVSVRYGNVINSTWSIVPILQQKIKNNEHFKLTSEEMTRFIITEENAIQLIFDAFHYGLWWEVIVPKLDSCKVTTLMHATQKINNYSCKIELIWLRPWEKIHELMINQSEWSRIINYKNRYIIPSLIQHYKDINEKFTYINEGKQIQMWEYSSANSLISEIELIEKYADYLLIK